MLDVRSVLTGAKVQISDFSSPMLKSRYPTFGGALLKNTLPMPPTSQNPAPRSPTVWWNMSKHAQSLCITLPHMFKRALGMAKTCVKYCPRFHIMLLRFQHVQFCSRHIRNIFFTCLEMFKACSEDIQTCFQHVHSCMIHTCSTCSKHAPSMSGMFRTRVVPGRTKTSHPNFSYLRSCLFF